MATNAEQTARPTVLVVEDEFIIALDLSETVRDIGMDCEGPFRGIEGAFVAIDRKMPDCAILDVMTDDGEVFPLADALQEAGVPIIFHSGHLSDKDVCDRYPDAIACAKPCPPDVLIASVNKALGHTETTH